MPQLVTRWLPRIRLNRLIGLSLIATLVLIAFSSIFTLTPSAHAQSQVPSNQVKSQLITTNSSNPRSGGCWSWDTWSDAPIADTGEPPMYQNYGTGPALGLELNSCEQYIVIKWSDLGRDYYQVDWTRPGLNGWQHFNVAGPSYDGYMYYNFNNAHLGTSYNFAVKGCTSHWYGDSCTDWSPTVGITT